MGTTRKKVLVPGHDRYLPYRLIGRSVAFQNPRRKGTTVKGVVRDVVRDIFEEAVRLELEDGRRYEFKEPGAIVRQDGDVVFAYGDAGPEATDEEMFEKAAAKGYEDDLHEAMKKTARAGRKEVRIFVLADEPSRGRRRRR